MFDVEKYEKRPNKTDELLGLEEGDFSNLIEELHTDGVINNIHYDIQSGCQLDGILRVEFINKK